MKIVVPLPSLTSALLETPLTRLGGPTAWVVPAVVVLSSWGSSCLFVSRYGVDWARDWLLYTPSASWSCVKERVADDLFYCWSEFWVLLKKIRKK